MVCVDPVAAQEDEAALRGQFMLGTMALEKETARVAGDSYDLPFVGLAVQKQVNTGRLELGVETGMLFSIRGETRVVSVSGGSGGASAKVTYDNKMLLFDYFGGVYMGGCPFKRLRLYAGCGPLIVYGQREIEPEPYGPPDLETETDAGLSVGLYGRAGAELQLTEHFILGAGVRGLTTGLKLKSSIGSTRVEGLQYLVSLGFMF
jgi:hypothetical protein